MYQLWRASYKGHIIEIENDTFTRLLWIDHNLERKNVSIVKGELIAVIPQGDGAGEEIHCLFHGFWRPTYDLRINANPVDVSRESVRDPRDMAAIFVAVIGSNILGDLFRSHLSRPARILLYLPVYLVLWFLTSIALGGWRGWRKWAHEPQEMRALNLSGNARSIPQLPSERSQDNKTA
jgi:hypothetical protein